jgi:AcrR family transcriptional regulator
MQQLIEAGAKEYFESAAADPFQGLSMTAVAARANVSRNALLYYWKTKNEYTKSLAMYLLEMNSLFDQTEEALKFTVEKAQKLKPWAAIQAVADADLSWLDIPEWPSVEMLTLFASRNEQLREHATKGFRDIDESTWTNYYAPVAQLCGRTPRLPLTGSQIGLLLQALVEGAGIRRLVEPTAFCSPDEESKSELLAYGVAAILALCTSTEDDTRTMGQVIKETFGTNRTPRKRL